MKYCLWQTFESINFYSPKFSVNKYVGLLIKNNFPQPPPQKKSTATNTITKLDLAGRLTALSLQLYSAEAWVETLSGLPSADLTESVAIFISLSWKIPAWYFDYATATVFSIPCTSSSPTKHPASRL
jgi:hypothetical protein